MTITLPNSIPTTDTSQTRGKKSSNFPSAVLSVDNYNDPSSEPSYIPSSNPSKTPSVIPIILVVYRHMYQVWIHPDLWVFFQAVSKLNSALDLSHKYKKDASTQRKINMVREATYNTIGHLKDLLNETN